MAESHERGKDLETRVEDVFRAAGFQVDRGRALRGQEWDIIASRHEIGGFETKIAVECKARRTKSVSNDEVMSFLVAFEASRGRLGFTHGIVVTDRDFARGASEAANDVPHVRLMTLYALESELLGAHLYLKGAMRNYRSHIKRRLIDPPAQEMIGADLAPVSGIIDRLSGALGQEQESFTFLLGDFGSGKTTVAEQVHKGLAEQYLANEGQRFPFLFYLRNLAQFDTDRAFVEAQLAQQSSSATYELYEQMQRLGQCVLILDGLDEVATHASQEERFRLFARVMRIAQGANHLLITSRPTYFNNLTELNGLIRELTSRDFRAAAAHRRGERKTGRAAEISDRLQVLSRGGGASGSYRLFNPWNTRLFYILPFSEEDIVNYLAGFEAEFRAIHGLTVREVFDFLSGIYDLTDLITRPLLLEMLVELIIIPGLLELDDPDLHVGPAELYRAYVEYHLNRDWEVRKFLTRSERRLFARAAAIAMLDSQGSWAATYESIEKIVLDGMPNIPRAALLKSRMTEVVNDVRICAFLNVTANDRIEFAHKSFMEYFVADVIVEKLDGTGPIAEFERVLNYEILYFVGSHCLNDLGLALNLRDHLKALTGTPSAVYLSNLQMAQLYSERTTEGRTYAGISLARALIRKRRFTRCRFENVSISGLTLDAVEFEGCEFFDASLTGDCGGSAFYRCEGVLELGSTLRNVQITGSRLEVTAHNAKLRFEGGAVRESHLRIRAETVDFQAVELANAVVRVEGGGSVRIEGEALRRSDLLSIGASSLGQGRALLVLGGVLESCHVSGFRLRAENHEDSMAALASCYGVAFFTGTRDALEPLSKHRTDLGRDLPKCVIRGRMIYVLGSVSSGVDVGQADLAELLRRGDMSAARQALAKLLREPEPA
jgi:uncharacterized protein YjbI with pentapeptide repeats